MKVRGIGALHRVYVSIMNILNMKNKNILDLGAGLGFISFYILFEINQPNNPVKSVTAVDFDYNYMKYLSIMLLSKTYYYFFRLISSYNWK